MKCIHKEIPITKIQSDHFQKLGPYISKSITRSILQLVKFNNFFRGTIFRWIGRQCILYTFVTSLCPFKWRTFLVHRILILYESVTSYMSTMMSYRYLPYLTLPTRITQFSTTCIDHIFLKKTNKEKVLSTSSGMFYCDISDHLPRFISLQYANNSYTGNRPMTRIFGARNCSKFVQRNDDRKLEW